MADARISRARLVLPAQSGPTHESVDRQAASERPADVPEVAHWAGHTRSRHVGAVVLALVALGSVACLALTIATRSVPAATALGCCLLGVIVIRAAMMSADRTTVDLRGPLLTVEHDGAVHTIDLSSSYRIIETRGEPGTKQWRFLAETDDAQVLVLGPRDVDAHTIQAALRHYREIANGKRRPDPINWRD